MTGEKLNRHLASTTGLSQKKISEVLDSLQVALFESLNAGEKTTVSGLGTFYRGTRAARRGVNPITGEAILIPEMVVPGIRFSSSFKRDLRSKIIEGVQE